MRKKLKEGLIKIIIKLAIKIIIKLVRKDNPYQLLSLSDDQWIFLKNVACLIHFADEKGFKLTGGELYRSYEQQLIHYEAGRTKTKNSKHMKRLAIDFNIFYEGKYPANWDDSKILGDYWCSLHPNNRWGGDFNKDGIKNGFIDQPHFEMNI